MEIAIGAIACLTEDYQAVLWPCGQIPHPGLVHTAWHSEVSMLSILVKMYSTSHKLLAAGGESLSFLISSNLVDWQGLCLECMVLPKSNTILR